MNGDDEITVTLAVTVEVESGTDIQALAHNLFDTVARDPENLFPEVMVVLSYEAVVEQ